MSVVVEVEVEVVVEVVVEVTTPALLLVLMAMRRAAEMPISTSFLPVSVEAELPPAVMGDESK